MRATKLNKLIIITSIRRNFGVYFGPSTIYPLLSTLEEGGYIQSQWDLNNDRPRKVYSLTHDGHSLLNGTEFLEPRLPQAYKCGVERKMQGFLIPEFPRLRGGEAIEALYEFMNELEGERGKELTEKQTAALIKLAKALISSSEADMQLDAFDKGIKETRCVTHIKQTIRKYIPEHASFLRLR